MKINKLLLRFALAFSLLTITPLVYAWDRPEINQRIIFTLVDYKPEFGHPRTPIEEPQVGQTDHTLYFFDETALTLNIYSVDGDGDETLEYTTAVSATTTEVQLPSTLSGTYIIEVVRDTLYFRGEIEL